MPRGDYCQSLLQCLDPKPDLTARSTGFALKLHETQRRLKISSVASMICREYSVNTALGDPAITSRPVSHDDFSGLHGGTHETFSPKIQDNYICIAWVARPNQPSIPALTDFYLPLQCRSRNRWRFVLAFCCS